MFKGWINNMSACLSLNSENEISMIYQLFIVIFLGCSLKSGFVKENYGI